MSIAVDKKSRLLAYWNILENMNKNLYPNTTQVPNVIIDCMSTLSNNELRIVLLITRKTVGWHKETDYLAYSQIKELTNLSKQSVSTGVNQLVKRGLIKRVDLNGKSLEVMPTGYRGKVFYTLSKQLVKNLDRSKNYTSTGLKIRPNKTNYNKTNRTNGDTISNKNVDNLLITKTTGLSKIQPLTDKAFHELIVNKTILGKDFNKDNIVTPHQAYGFEVVQKLNLEKEYLLRVIRSCKKKDYYKIKTAIDSTLKAGSKLNNANDRAKYFFKVLQS